MYGHQRCEQKHILYSAYNSWACRAWLININDPNSSAMLLFQTVQRWNTIFYIDPSWPWGQRLSYQVYPMYLSNVGLILLNLRSFGFFPSPFKKNAWSQFNSAHAEQAARKQTLMHEGKRGPRVDNFSSRAPRFSPLNQLFWRTCSRGGLVLLVFLISRFRLKFSDTSKTEQD